MSVYITNMPPKTVLSEDSLLAVSGPGVGQSYKVDLEEILSRLDIIVLKSGVPISSAGEAAASSSPPGAAWVLTSSADWDLIDKGVLLEALGETFLCTGKVAPLTITVDRWVSISHYNGFDIFTPYIIANKIDGTLDIWDYEGVTIRSDIYVSSFVAGDQSMVVGGSLVVEGVFDLEGFDYYGSGAGFSFLETVHIDGLMRCQTIFTDGDELTINARTIFNRDMWVHSETGFNVDIRDHSGSSIRIGLFEYPINITANEVLVSGSSAVIFSGDLVLDGGMDTSGANLAIEVDVVDSTLDGVVMSGSGIKKLASPNTYWAEFAGPLTDDAGYSLWFPGHGCISLVYWGLTDVIYKSSGFINLVPAATHSDRRELVYNPESKDRLAGQSFEVWTKGGLFYMSVSIIFDDVVNANEVIELQLDFENVDTSLSDSLPYIITGFSHRFTSHSEARLERSFWIAPLDPEAYVAIIPKIRHDLSELLRPSKMQFGLTKII